MGLNSQQCLQLPYLLVLEWPKDLSKNNNSGSDVGFATPTEGTPFDISKQTYCPEKQGTQNSNPIGRSAASRNSGGPSTDTGYLSTARLSMLLPTSPHKPARPNNGRSIKEAIPPWGLRQSLVRLALFSPTLLCTRWTCVKPHFWSKVFQLLICREVSRRVCSSSEEKTGRYRLPQMTDFSKAPTMQSTGIIEGRRLGRCYSGIVGSLLGVVSANFAYFY